MSPRDCNTRREVVQQKVSQNRRTWQIDRWAQRGNSGREIDRRERYIERFICAQRGQLKSSKCKNLEFEELTSGVAYIRPHAVSSRRSFLPQFHFKSFRAFLHGRFLPFKRIFKCFNTLSQQFLFGFWCLRFVLLILGWKLKYFLLLISSILPLHLRNSLLVPKRSRWSADCCPIMNQYWKF